MIDRATHLLHLEQSVLKADTKPQCYDCDETTPTMPYVEGKGALLADARTVFGPPFHRL